MLHEKLNPEIKEHFRSQLLAIVADKVRRGGLSGTTSEEALFHVFAVDVIARVLKMHVEGKHYDPIVEIQRRVPEDSLHDEVDLAIKYGYTILGSEFRNLVIDELNKSYWTD